MINSQTIESYKNETNIKIIKIIKTFCLENNIILEFDNNSIDFEFILYSVEPYKHSNNLSNLLYQEISKFIILYTKIENKELAISVNNQKIIFIKLLFIPNRSIFEKFDIIPQNKNLIIMPDMINLYLQTEENINLDNILKNNLIDKEKYQSIIPVNKKNINKQHIDKNSIKNKVIKELYSFLKQYDIIFLDYYGLNENIDTFNNTLQFIYQVNIINEIKNKINESLKKLNIEADIIINTDRTYMINNFRLRKILIYLSIYNKKYKSFNKINILNCFNELEYNILPVLISNKNITHPYILLKYVIINLIYIQLYSNTKHISYFDNIEYLKKILAMDNNDIKKYKFIGIYKNEELDLYIYNVYRPYQYFLKYNNLRII